MTPGCPSASATCSPSIPTANAIEFDGRWRTWGELADTVGRVAALVDRPGTEVGILLRNRPASVGLLLGVLRAGGCVVTVNPGAAPTGRATTSPRSTCRSLAGDPTDLAALVPAGSRAHARSPPTDLGEPARPSTPGDGDAGRAGSARRRRADADQRHHRAAQAHRPHLRHPRAGAGRGQALRVQPRRRPCGCARAWPSSTRRSCTSAACSGCCSA